MKKIQLFLKYLVLMLFLTVWIIIMFFTDYMNSQSVKLYCMFVVGCGCAYSIWEKTYVPDARSYIAEKAIALILIGIPNGSPECASTDLPKTETFSR